MYLSSPENVISVTELNRQVRLLLEGSFPVMWISGEISGFKRYDSGHCYFTLKDAGAQVRCVMFRNRAALLDFAPQEGMRVEARAVVSLYEARGDFQLTIEALRPGGLGALFEAFEALKRKLEAEGLFSPARKQPLPRLPRSIGIVTSPAAAALRDVLTTLKRRMPGIPLILYPTAVQGMDAARQIAAAIRTADNRHEVDTLIICRGGGSIEDLWPFNEEIVARAIADCTIPVICGIGHETDFTIADFVADQRAPTPTAAAELVCPSRNELQNALRHMRQRMQSTLERQLQQRMQHLDMLARRLRHPGERLQYQRERLQRLQQRLHALPERLVAYRGLRLEQLQLRLQHSRLKADRYAQKIESSKRSLQQNMSRLITQRQQQLANLAVRLEACNPHTPLQRGYALVMHADGSLISDAGQAHPQERITVQFATNTLQARVTDTPASPQGELPL